jgi:hypothetical protein
VIKRISPRTVVATAALLSLGVVAAPALARGIAHRHAESARHQLPRHRVRRGPRETRLEQTITVVNLAGVQANVLRQVEAAVAVQSGQLREAWGTPLVRFGPGGWRVYIVTSPATVPRWIEAQTRSDGDYWGLHSQESPSDVPYAVATTEWSPWSEAFSHEILEMLVDPRNDRLIHGHLAEPCDPVEDTPYLLDGVWVSDFVPPSWFTTATGADT